IDMECEHGYSSEPPFYTAEYTEGVIRARDEIDEARRAVVNLACDRGLRLSRIIALLPNLNGPITLLRDIDQAVTGALSEPPPVPVTDEERCVYTEPNGDRCRHRARAGGLCGHHTPASPVSADHAPPAPPYYRFVERVGEAESIPWPEYGVPAPAPNSAQLVV